MTIKLIKGRVVKRSSEKTYRVSVRISAPKNKQRLQLFKDKTYLMHDPCDNTIIGSNIYMYIKKMSKEVTRHKYLGEIK